MRIITDPRCLEHRPPAAFPEKPERLSTILDHLRGAGRAVEEAPRDAEACRRAVTAVHPPEYVERFERAVARGDSLFDSADNPVAAGTADGAWGAVAAVLAAADAAAAGEAAFAAVRPPGHHAFADLAGGFCFLNNSGIAAERLRAQGRRPAILDVDVHHGNGTQGIFYDRDDVLTVSIHADPARFYPFFWGHAQERGAGRGKTLFVDAYVAGVAGDMFVAALLDLGVPISALETQLAALDDLVGYRLDVLGTERSCVVAPRFVVSEVGPEPQPLRDYAQIRAMLETSRLDPGVRDKALRAFASLARGESAVHGVPVENVHFHEVGAVDSIVDIVAVAAGLDYMQCEEVVVSPLPMGRGVLRGAAHGPLPCPPPATVSCLCDAGVPTHDPGVDGEFVTPTGACLVAALKTSAERWPDMFLPERCAYGAGTKRWRDRPNLLRLVLGARAGKP